MAPKLILNLLLELFLIIQKIFPIRKLNTYLKATFLRNGKICRIYPEIMLLFNRKTISIFLSFRVLACFPHFMSSQ